MRQPLHLLGLLVAAFLVLPATARENIGISGRHAASYKTLATDCNDATSQIDLDINNVRTRLLGAGDLWWDLNNGRYVVPKVDPSTGEIEVSSLFAGALWVGGIDAGGQLKIAAQTYRQSGNDFWPGPLDGNGSTNQDVCSAYDRHWKVTRLQVDDHIALAAVGVPISLASIPDAILEWPARNNPYARGKNDAVLLVDRNLAPFIDLDGNGEYDPTQGDYPDVDGDQAVFWVYNDKGNIHTESGGDAIGIEIQAQAFGFQTSDEINDMTFYRYQILNFSPTNLDSTFFAMWVDADLGWFSNDFVGCDTALDLGICFNGTAIDNGGSPNYGASPPIVGTDFFQGPKKFFNTSGGRDSILLGMSAFLYYNNDFSTIGNPEVAAHYYGYMAGTWKDGSPFTQGGNGYGGSVPSNFLFPDDPSLPLPAWSECSQANPPADRRYLQSAGPFRLEVGAKNEVVVGVVWVRPESQTGCQADFDLIRSADEKAQALFDSDFRLIDGPDAPDMAIRELDREILISLTNAPTSNNAGEVYEETDPIIKNIVSADPGDDLEDSTYNFQGYIIYQLRDGQVSTAEYSNPDAARVIGQVDVKDGIARLVNLSFDQILNADVPELMVDGTDQGIRHAFRVTEDGFAESERNLVNHQTYYFSVVAYAYNNFADYDPSDPNTQKLPYLQGRKNVKVYTGIPHIPTPENNGTVLNSEWGDGPELTREEGKGNGGNVLEVTPESEARILATGFDEGVTYQGRFGPVDVMISDPLKVPFADFELVFGDTTLPTETLNPGGTSWTLTNLTSGESVTSDLSIDILNEQLIVDWGLAVTAFQNELVIPTSTGIRREPAYPGGITIDTDGSTDTDPVYFERTENNGFLEATIVYDSPSESWLTGVADGEAQAVTNWILSGVNGTEIPPGTLANIQGIDDDQVYESVLGGTISPSRLMADNADFVPLGNVIGAKATISMDDLHSVDVVMTADKDLWTRCVVVETAENGLSEFSKSDVKLRPSVGKDGQPDGSGDGKGWFPGYAIDLETGERLNIVFGESTWLANSNGNDMIWNPTDEFFDPLFNPRYGGKHYVYVMNTRYDEGNAFLTGMLSGGTVDRRNSWNKAMWVTMPYVAQGFALTSIEDGLIPTTTRIRLRVSQPYAVFPVANTNGGINKYTFSTRTLAATVDDATAASTACDLINIVPNPYYAFSAYEPSTLDNRVKITNLPPVCVVSIYALDGTLIRRIVRDVAPDNTGGGTLNATTSNLDSSLDWDLKNEADVPVASGIYLIHVEAEGLCEVTLKWLGVLRPIDLDTF